MQKKLLPACMIGTIFEFLDYTLYGFAIPVLATRFFPFTKTLTAQIILWCIFSISFVVRPIGAFLFGRYGDRISRWKTLKLTIILMSLSTAFLGIIPGFSQIGMLSPLLLILCRIMQGLAISAEYSGSSIYLAETYLEKKGKYSSIIACGSGLGVFTAISLALMIEHIPVLNISTLWSITFILTGCIAGIIGYYLRRRMPEAEAFQYIKTHDLISHSSVFQKVKQNWQNFILTMVLSAFVCTAWYIFMVYLANYLQETLFLPRNFALLITAIAVLVEAGFTLFFGRMSDRWGRRKMFLISSHLVVLFAIPSFLLMSVPNLFYIVFILLFLAILLASVDGILPGLLADINPIASRYSMVSLGYNIGGALLGGLAPAIMAFLLSVFKFSWIPGAYITLFAVLAIVSLRYFGTSEISATEEKRGLMVGTHAHNIS
ncbi:MAG: MFS transporter [Gammaproteobacteria bacterium]